MALSMLATFLRHPLLLLKFLKLVKSTQLYMSALVADYFRDLLAAMDSPEKAKTPDAIMEENGYTNRQLFDELMALLEEDKFIRIEDGKILSLKPVPQDVIKETEKSLMDEVVESFQTFLDPTKKAITDRLKGIPVGDFDAGELRIQWNIALRGEFYNLQRRKAYDFSNLSEWVKQRKQPINFLDYGCGSGDGTKQLYEFLEKTGADFSIEACDVSEGLMEIAEEDETLELPIYYFSLKEKEPREGFYDAIFVSQVMHWIENPTELVSKMKSWLKPNGMIFGVQGNNSKRLYHVDLFIRLLGSQGFPTIEAMEKWFKDNDMELKYNKIFGLFMAVKK